MQVHQQMNVNQSGFRIMGTNESDINESLLNSSSNQVKRKQDTKLLNETAQYCAMLSDTKPKKPNVLQ
jgi:hypothetical protein